MKYTNINIPANVICCPDRTHVYLLLVFKGLPDWCDQDYADWFYATGWNMPQVAK